MIKIIITSFIIIIIMFIIYKVYNPTIDFVTTNDKIIVLLWYNKYYNDIEYTRTYIKLIEF